MRQRARAGHSPPPPPHHHLHGQSSQPLIFIFDLCRVCLNWSRAPITQTAAASPERSLQPAPHVLPRQQHSLHNTSGNAAPLPATTILRQVSSSSPDGPLSASPDLGPSTTFAVPAGVTMLSAMETAVKCEVDLPLNLKTHVSTTTARPCCRRLARATVAPYPTLALQAALAGTPGRLQKAKEPWKPKDTATKRSKVV
ncbi:uncharacterized protein LOC126998715 [Eriocheir sinensis]|uniref:uncharacterized protein LOC126998715 n=1 Tax=Eriocheir sinensis TaxID=95602 RepID=UPI0021C6C5ED|nr:uncharacterized protein LOC126998715 [Eriocheir sinensis]